MQNRSSPKAEGGAEPTFFSGGFFVERDEISDRYRVLEIIRSGETLGLATMLARLPRLFGVRTVTPSSLISIAAQGLLALVC